MRENCVLVIAGPSAVGKTVVAKALAEKDPRFTFLRSGTTRAKRGDAHDDEYLYYTEEEFMSAVGRGEFAEYMRYGGNLYGTPKSELDRAFGEGRIPLMVLDLEGVRSMALLDGYSACSVYVYADLATIESCLFARSFADGRTEKSEAIYKQRCEQNKSDFLSLPSFAEYVFKFVLNTDTVEACRDTVERIFREFSDGAPFTVTENATIADELMRSANK